MRSCLESIPADTKRVFVAYSGGLDSSVLLHLLTRSEFAAQTTAWHVNHGLVAAADEMERFCVEQARILGVELRIDRLDLGQQNANIEAEARRQRYALFQRHSRLGDCILTAHHADDQAETFLLNALRGSGSAGLRAIAPERRLGDSLLLRPLLNVDRAELEVYAEDHEISWCDDPSNRSDRFDRNYLRNRVCPALRQRWPRYHAALSMSARLQAETQDLLDEVAAADLGLGKGSAADGSATLRIDFLLRLSPARRANLLRYWIAQAGFAPLPHARLHELMRQLHARSDASPKIEMPGYSVRLYDRRLFLVDNRAEPPRDSEYRFDRAPRIEIEALDLYFSRAEVFQRLGLEDRNQALAIKFRRRGEDNRDRHRLKRLFQKLRVPPWRRASVAQVYLDGRLAGLLL